MAANIKAGNVDFEKGAAISFIFRVLVSVVFCVSAAPKVLTFGKDPSKPLESKILRKKATWFEMEMTAAHFSWTQAFGYPSFLLRPLGISILIAVVLLNAAPPPSSIGIGCCMFFTTILGGAIYTWFVQYNSPKHAVPAVVSIMAITIVSCNKTDQIILQANDISWRLLLFKRIIGPLILGFLGGPIFVYIGERERSETLSNPLSWGLNKRRRREY